MVPIVDFEEFNQNQDEQNLELKYILINLYESLPRLSEHCASALMLRFPSSPNEEISFHPFPKTNFMEVKEI